MLKAYFVSLQRMQELREGRGGVLLDGFSQALNRLGYATVTARRHIRAAEHLIYWAETERLMYRYRQILVRVRRGDSDRDIARSKTMGRKKITKVREITANNGRLAQEAALPDKHVMVSLLARKEAPPPSSCVSTRKA